METEIRSEEIDQVQELASLLSEMINQFIKTREELMRTTLQVQIELLTNRLNRLRISINEIKSQIDISCVPKEVKLVELEIGTEIRPYEGAEIEVDDSVKEFSWKSKKSLETEKKEILPRVSETLRDTVNRIYDIYVARASFLCGIEEKSRIR